MIATMRRGLVLAAALLCLAAAPPVRIISVDAHDVSLDYQLAVGAEDCPREQVFRSRTADLYDWRDPFVKPGASATWGVRVEIRHDSAGYHGSIRVIDPGTGKAIKSSSEETKQSCDLLVWELSRFMGLVISESPPPPAPAPSAPSKDATAALGRRLDALEEAAEDQSEINKQLLAKIAALQKALDEEKKRKMDLTYALSAGALITANLTSNVGPGAWVGGELRTGPIAVGLELRATFPSRIEGTSSLDFDLSQYTALLTPCGRYSYFFGCLVAGGGTLFAYDSNLPQGTESGFKPLIQLGGRLGLEVPFGESMFAGRAWGEVLYSTPPFGVDYYVGAKTYSADRPDVSAFFGLGVVVRFGKEGT